MLTAVVVVWEKERGKWEGWEELKRRRREKKEKKKK